MSASGARRAACAFFNALLVLAAASGAFAHTGSSASSTLAVTAIVLTKCSVDAASPVVPCSQPVEVERTTSTATLLVDGEPRRFIISTINF